MKRLRGKIKDGSKVSYDDKPVKDFLIEFFSQNFSWELKVNLEKYGIDLLSVNGDCPDVECERGNWNGNFWENKGYSSFLSDASPSIKHQTVNIPYRKRHYWVEGDHYKESGKFWYTEKNHLTNLFARTNFEFTQVILIKPEVIRDETKCHIAGKKPVNIHKNEIEYWMGFKNEDVDTWNYNTEKKVWELSKIEHEV